MDRKADALKTSLHQLDEIEKGVAGDVIDNPQVLSNKINHFIESLKSVFEEGCTMDESTIFPIPVELLQHIDSESNNNPELYQHELIESCLARANDLSDKLNYLDSLASTSNSMESSDNILGPKST